MTVTTTRKTAKKQRTMQYYPASGIIFITDGNKTDGYLVANSQEETHCEEPTFYLTKADGTQYNVLLHGEHSLCDCKGFEHRGMNTKDGKGCKHIAALTKLHQIGKL